MMSNKTNSVLYIGVTSDIYNRTLDHKEGIHKRSFTHRYNCHKLVYYEEYGYINEAIRREKQLKKWKRDWKNKLVDKLNPEWKDLHEHFTVEGFLKSIDSGDS